IVNVPFGATSGPLSVRTLAGTTTSSNYFYTLPIIQKVDPSKAIVGDQIMMTGISFTGLTTVRIGTAIAPFQVLSPTNLVATVPTNAPFEGLIQVENPYFASVGVPFLLLPKIDSFAPSNGPPGTIVTIRGSGIQDAKSVT